MNIFDTLIQPWLDYFSLLFGQLVNIPLDNFLSEVYVVLNAASLLLATLLQFANIPGLGN